MKGKFDSFTSQHERVSEVNLNGEDGKYFLISFFLCLASDDG